MGKKQRIIYKNNNYYDEHGHVVIVDKKNMKGYLIFKEQTTINNYLQNRLLFSLGIGFMIGAVLRNYYITLIVAIILSIALEIYYRCYFIKGLIEIDIESVESKPNFVDLHKNDSSSVLSGIIVACLLLSGLLTYNIFLHVSNFLDAFTFKDFDNGLLIYFTICVIVVSLWLIVTIIKILINRNKH